MKNALKIFGQLWVQATTDIFSFKILPTFKIVLIFQISTDL